MTGNPELVATVNRRKAADLGVSVMDVALASQLLIGGVKVSRFEEAGRDYDILVRADEAARTSPEALSQLTVASTKLGTVPLLDVVDLKKGEGPSKIERFARQRRVMFLANTAPGVGSGEVGAALETAVKELKLPAEYTFGAFGQSKEIKRTGHGVHVRVRPVVPLHVPDPGGPVRIVAAPDHDPAVAAADGAVRAGVAAFLEVVARHLHHARHPGAVRRREEELDPADRAHHPAARGGALAATTRSCTATGIGLRPILMTTFAFVAGMLPLVTSHGIGAEFNRATAGPVVIGQLLSLLLTLLATPVAYSLLRRRLQRAAAPVPDFASVRTPRPGADEIMGPPPVVPEGNGHHRPARVEAAS